MDGCVVLCLIKREKKLHMTEKVKYVCWIS